MGLSTGDEMKVFFDLDGVLANFDEKVAGILKLPYWDRADNSHWAVLEKEERLYLDLNVLPDALPMFDRVVRNIGLENVEILGALPRPTGLLKTADEDKRLWVQDIVHPEVKVNTVVGGVNKCLYLDIHPGSVLIDDYERNIKAWVAKGGIGIHHTDPHSTVAKLKVLGIIKWP